MSQLEVGHQAPPLRLTDQRGETFDLTRDAQRRTVVFFFPKAFTPGCTTQACDMRDNLSSLHAAGVDVLGVSGDDPQTLARFHDEHALPYTLLSDPDHETAKEWGAWGSRTIAGETSDGPLRSTFVLTPEGEILAAHYRVDATGHVAWLRQELGL